MVLLSLGVLPAAHFWHAVPSLLYLPCCFVTSHKRHTLLGVLGALPLSHLRQASPLADTWPPPQPAQLVFFAFGDLPGSQRSHVPLAPASPFSQLTHAVLLALSGLSLLPAAQRTHAFFVELKYDG